MAANVKDFEPESFTLEKYVEKMAQLNPNTGLGPLSKSKSKPFEPKVLLESFESSIRSLCELAEKNQRRVDKLEHVCTKQEKEHIARIRDLDNMYQEAFSEFQTLEDRITYVSTKVVHLGDQLESSNNRRTRSMEAQNLMKYLTEFEVKSKPSLPVFTDSSRKMEAADLVFKLHTLVGELPDTAQYKKVKSHISEKYADVEGTLVDEFIESHCALDTRRMKMYAKALQPFPYGSSKVIENYIHHNLPTSQSTATDELFRHVEKTCKKTHDQIVDVFDNPDVVMTKFVQAMIDRVIMKHVDSELLSLSRVEAQKEKYLAKLHDLYGKTMALQAKMARYEMTMDSALLAKMTRVNLFSKYLSSYADTETSHLTMKSGHALAEFCDMVGIARKSGASRLTIPASRNPDETYVSQEVCTSILHEAKGAIRRAETLLSSRELSELVKSIYFIVLEKLCSEHFHTALDIGQTMDPKSAPTGLFCMVVGNVNSNMHLIEKLFREVIMPCIHYPPVATACIDRKRDVTSKLEAKIESGIERTITGMVNCAKQVLSSMQKKTDFRPENPEVAVCTPACARTVSYIGECCRVLQSSLDGKNLEVVLLEFGVALHRVIYEHIQLYTINDIGAMNIICDMNEYRRVMKEFRNPFLDELFEKMQTLCNLFIVKSDNLIQVCSEEPYVNFDRSVLHNMMQLRADYKTAKLQKLLAVP